MTLTILALLGALAVTIAAIAIWFEWKLIDEFCSVWHLWSVRANGLGLAILSWVSFDPVSALYVWNMLPGAASRHIHPAVLAGIGAGLFGIAMLSRVVAQPKARK